MNSKDMMKRFISAAGLLPERLWRAAFTLNEDERLRTEEFRLRCGRPLRAVVAGKTRDLLYGGERMLVTPEELSELMTRATQSSVHTFNPQIRAGFVTLPMGHRLGLCGEIVMEGRSAATQRAFSSVNLRIAKEFVGLSEPFVGRCAADRPENTLILSPPGAGKTTLLRDFARVLSQRFTTAIADERMEIAACLHGAPQFDVGNCDVLSGGTKRMCAEMLLRSMSPQVIVFDEITAEEDVAAIEKSSYCGCRFLVSAHAAALAELNERPVYRRLMALNLFTRIILIGTGPHGRVYTFFMAGGESDAQAVRGGADHAVVLGDRVFTECRT